MLELNIIHPIIYLYPGRGGQSALRFARLRMEKRHNYVRKVAEVAVTLFISNDRPNVAGLVMAGSADFKTELSQSDMFDPVSNTIYPIRYIPYDISYTIYPIRYILYDISYTIYPIQYILYDISYTIYPIQYNL